MGLTWSTIPNICGLPLRVGTLWIAETCTMLSLLSVWNSSIMSSEPVLGMHSLKYVPVLSLIVWMLQAIFSMCLVAGVYTKISVLVIPWVIYNIIIMILIVIFLAIHVFMHSAVFLANQTILVLIFSLLIIAFVPQRYFITGVYSYYKELKNHRAPMPEVWTRDNGEIQSLTQI